MSAQSGGPQGASIGYYEVTNLVTPYSVAALLPQAADGQYEPCVVVLQCPQVVDSNNKGNKSIRYTTDGTDPTADHGIELNPGQSVTLIYGIANLKVIQAGSVTASSSSSGIAAARVNIRIEPYKRFNV